MSQPAMPRPAEPGGGTDGAAAPTSDVRAAGPSRAAVAALAVPVAVLAGIAASEGDPVVRIAAAVALLCCLAVGGALRAGARRADAAVRDALGSAQEARAADLARHQRAVAAVYATAARRSQALVERQLEVIEQLEQHEEDPAVLQRLFALDHLSTRMAREATSMLVLAGEDPVRRVTGRPPLSEVVRAAVGEVEDYTRVDLHVHGDRGVDPPLIAPLVHLLAELVDNAAVFSPPEERVRVSVDPAPGGGARIAIRDRGIGLDDERVAAFNERLASPAEHGAPEGQRLGLEVVARLAVRHGLGVELSHNADGSGVTATVEVPAAVLDPVEAQAPEIGRSLSSAGAPGAPAHPGHERPAAPTSVGHGSSGGAALPAPAEGPAPAAAGPSRSTEPDAGPPAGTPAREVVPPRPAWIAAVDRSAAAGPGPGPGSRSPADAGTASAWRAGSTGGPAPSIPPAARTGVHTGARATAAWSYSGHLRAPAAEPAPPSPAPAAGRGSRSRVSSVAPRQGGFAGADGTPPAAAPQAGREVPGRWSPDGPDRVGGGASPQPAAAGDQPPDRGAAQQPRGGSSAATSGVPGVGAGPQWEAGGGGAAGAPPLDRGAAQQPRGGSAATSGVPGAGAAPQRGTWGTGGGGAAGAPHPAEDVGPRPAGDHPAAWPAAGGGRRPTGPGEPAEAGGGHAPPSWAAATGAHVPVAGSDPGVGEAAQLLEGLQPDRSAPPADEPRRPTPAELLDAPGGAGWGAAAGPAAREVPPGRAQDPVRMRMGGELPQRTPGASLPPGLREGAADPDRSASAAPVTREEARTLLSSYQTRLQAGRRAAEEQGARSGSDAEPPPAGGGDDDPAGSGATR